MNATVTETGIDVLVPKSAIDKVRAVLRAVAAGEPVDTPSVAAQAAHALAALPPSRPSRATPA